MSYILDALRRLEQDKERTRRGTNPVEAVLVPDLDGPRKEDRSRFWWLGVGVVLLAAAVATTYWITRQTLVFSTAQVEEHASQQLASVEHGDKRPEPTSIPEAASSRNRSKQLAPPSPSTPSPERERAEVATPSIRETASRPIGPGSSSQSPTSAREDLLATPEEAMALPRESFEDGYILPWTGEEIKINAIAWSRDRKQRFALVNLKTVREGDQFDGLSVVEIEEDGVVFEQGGTKYRVTVSVRSF